MLSFPRAPSPALVLAFAVLLGSAMDATIKYLGQSNDVLLVAFGRYVFGALFSLPPYLHARLPKITADMLRVHGLRGAMIACGGTGFFWAFTVLPLAEAIAYSFIGLLLIPIAASFMIGERLRPTSLAAGLLGFAGVLVAAQGAPSAAVSPHHKLGVVVVLISAALFALSMVLMRARAGRDGAPIVGLLSSAIPAVFLAGPALAFSSPPNWADWPIFLLMGAFAAGFLFFMSKAYARAEAQQLAPVHYTEFLWAGLLGYFIFSEMPRPQLLLGAVLIIAAGLFAAYDERRLSRKAGALKVDA